MDEDFRRKVPVSVLIPVRNEAANLARCLSAIRWAAQIFVVDSGSTDGTQKIAHDFGCEVVQFAFNGNWPKKKNWALDNLPFRFEWVLILDADEVFQPGAEDEIRGIVSNNRRSLDGYWVNRRFMFMGRWLKHAYYPNWNLRLFLHRKGRYERLALGPTASGDNEVHEHIIVEGKTGRMHAEMDHYAFPSIDVFVEKHNRYSNWEATVALEGGVKGHQQIQSISVRMRRLVKQIAKKLPFRPTLRFLYVYVIQGGFMDGREGYIFARLHGLYEFLSVAKTAEMRKERDLRIQRELIARQ